MKWFDAFYIRMVIFHFKEKMANPIKLNKIRAMQLGRKGRLDKETKTKFSQTPWRYKVEIQSF